jgi:hypothetical protein
VLERTVVSGGGHCKDEWHSGELQELESMNQVEDLNLNCLVDVLAGGRESVD